MLLQGCIGNVKWNPNERMHNKIKTNVELTEQKVYGNVGKSKRVTLVTPPNLIKAFVVRNGSIVFKIDGKKRKPIDCHK